MRMRRFRARLSELDERLSGRLHVHGEKSLPFRFFAFLSYSGDSWIICGALFVAWLFASGLAQRLLAYWGLAIALTAIFVLGLKALIRRSRPRGDWGTVYRRFDPYAFPSGHAVRGGLIAALAWNTLPRWAAALILIWALAMILSRVMTGVHYVSDIIAGFVLGMAIGFAFGSATDRVTAAFPILFDRGLWLPALRTLFSG